MKEYKSGTLKSGGSGKKVTNPKQAIAIALSEARNMNQGGMMYRPEIYDRPMFQTPEQRAAGGIMGGIAPINLANGSGPEPGPWGFTKAVGSEFWDMASEMEAPGVSDDFWSSELTEEGSGINARDLTDFFIVDPNDPVDVGIATVTVGLLALGITSPLAIITELARKGYKGKKVYDATKKAQKLTEAAQGGTKAGLYGTHQVAREAPGVPDLASNVSELATEVIPETYAAYQSQFDRDPYVNALQDYRTEFEAMEKPTGEDRSEFNKEVKDLYQPIADIPWDEKVQALLSLGSPDEIREKGEELGLLPQVIEKILESAEPSRQIAEAQGGITNLPREVAQGGIVYLAGGGKAAKKVGVEPLIKALERVAKGASDKVKEIEKVNKDYKAGKITEEQAQRRINKIDKQKVTQDLKPTPPKESKPKKVEDTPSPLGGGAVDTALLAPVLGAKDIAATAGRPLLDFAKRNPGATGAGIIGGGLYAAPTIYDAIVGEDEIPPEDAPAAAPTAPVTPVLPPPEVEDPSMWEKFDAMFDSPRNRAGFINMAKPTHGFAKRSPFVDFYEGAQDYDVREDEAETRKLSRQTALQQNFEFLKDKFPPGTSDKEIMDLLLKTSSGMDTREEFLTIFVKESIKSQMPVTPEDINKANDTYNLITDLVGAKTVEMEEKET